MKAFIVAAGLLALVAVAALAAPWLVDASAYRGEIAHQIEVATGRPVELGGDIDFALLPTPRLRAAAVRFAPAADGAGPAVTADYVDVEIGWRSLLGGAIEVDYLRLGGPKIVLDRPFDGELGDFWPDLDSGTSIRIERTDIENGRLVWHDPRSGTEESVEQIQAKLNITPLSGALRATGAAVIGGAPIAFDAVIGGAQDARRPVSATVTLRPKLARLSFRGTIDAAGSHDLRGRIQAEGDDLWAALEAAGVSVAPDRMLAAVLSQGFSLAGDLGWREGTIAVDGLSLQLGDLRATGTATAVLAKIPVIDLTLGATWIDLDRLAQLPPRTTQSAREAERESAAAIARLTGQAEPTRRHLPHGLDVAIDLTVDAMGLNGGVIRQSHFSAALSGGELIVNEISATLPGGTVLASAGQIMLGSQPTGIEGTLSLRSDNLRGLLQWLAMDVTDVPADRLRRFDGRARIGGSPDRVELSGLDIRFDSSRVQGGVTIVPGPRPALGVDLRLDQFNVDAYLGGAGRQPRPEGSGAQSLLARALPLVDAKLRLRAGTVTVGREPVEGVSMEGTLLNGQLAITRLDLRDLAGARVGAEGTISGLPDRPAMDLNVTIRTADGSRLLRLADITSARPLGTLAIQGRIEVQPGAGVTLSGLDLTVGESRITGNGRLVLEPGAHLALDLAADTLPLDAVLGAARLGRPGLDVDLVLRADALALGRQSIEAARVQARVTAGALTAELGGTLFGGALKAAMERAGSDLRGLRGTVMLANADLARALALLTGTGAVRGKADMQIAFSIEPRPDGEVWRALSGSARIVGGAGTLDGVDLPAAREAAIAGRSDDIDAALGSGSTAYESLNAKAAIEAGVARVEEIRLVSGSLPVRGQGTVDFGQGMIDLAFTVPLAESDGIPPLRVAFRGAIEKPHIVVDATTLSDRLRPGRTDGAAATR